MFLKHSEIIFQNSFILHVALAILLVMEKIKDIAKAIEGDLIHFKGSLFVIESISKVDDIYFLNVDSGFIIEIESDTVFSIFRLPFSLK